MNPGNTPQRPNPLTFVLMIISVCLIIMWPTRLKRTRSATFAAAKRGHSRSQSLQGLERMLEQDIYAQYVEDEACIDVGEEIVVEELPPVISDSLIHRFISPKQILSKVKPNEIVERPQYHKHCILGIVVFFLLLLLSFSILSARYLYDPNSIYSPIMTIPEVKVPRSQQKWSYRFPQPTNRNLLSVTGDKGSGFFVVGSQGTILYSKSVQDITNQVNSVPEGNYCTRPTTNESNAPFWSWLPSSIEGTFENIVKVEDMLYASVRRSDSTQRKLALNSTLLDPLSPSYVPWEESEVSFDGNVVFGNSVWLGLDQGQLFRSIDSITWEPLFLSFSQPFPFPVFTMESIAFGNGRFVIVGKSHAFLFSFLTTSNGTMPWQYRQIDPYPNNNVSPTIISFSSVSAGFVALFNQILQTSEDGIAWYPRFTPLDSKLVGLSCSGNARCIAVAVHSSTFIHSSTGGISWEVIEAGREFFSSHCDASDFCLVVGAGGAIMASNLLGNWSQAGSLHDGGVGTFVSNSDSPDYISAASWLPSNSPIEDNIHNEVGILSSTDGRQFLFRNHGEQIFPLIALNSLGVWSGSDGNSFYTSNEISSCSWSLATRFPQSVTVLSLTSLQSEFAATGYVIQDEGKHGVSFYSSSYGKQWNSEDTAIIIDQLIYCNYHNNFIGKSSGGVGEDSGEGLYYSAGQLQSWTLALAGSFIGMANDNRTGISLASDGTKLYKSTDGGWSWREKDYPCSIPVHSIGFIYNIGWFYMISGSSILVSKDQADSWEILEFPYRGIPLRSLSYSSGSLIGITKDCITYKAQNEWISTPSSAILSIPVANATFQAACPGNKRGAIRK